MPFQSNKLEYDHYSDEIMEKNVPIRGGRPYARGIGRGGDRGERGRGRGRGGPTDIQIFSHDPPIAPQLDQSLKAKENQELNLAKSASVSSHVTPPRPGYGTQGREIILWTNYFELVTKAKLELYRYHVQISGSDRTREIPKRIVKRIIAIFLAEHGLATEAVTDFSTMLLTLCNLDLPQNRYSVTYREAEEDELFPNAAVYTVRLQHTGHLTLASLLDQSTSTNSSSLFGVKQETIQALNILLGHFNKSQPRYAVLSRGRTYDTMASNSSRSGLGAGLEVIRGFIFSVRAATARVLINVQIKNLAFYQSGPLVDVVKGFIADRGSSTAGLENFLKKLKVDIMHIRRSSRAGSRIPRTKTIIGLAHKHNGRSLDHPPRVTRSGAGAHDVQFYLRAQPTKPSKQKGASATTGPSKGPSDVSGQYISVAKFFKQQHAINIVEPALPVVNVGTDREPSYLPLQVCHVVAGQPGLSKLSPTQTQRMIRFAVRRPHENATSIVSTGLQQLGLSPGSFHLDAFGISIEAKMLAVPGRVLQAPKVCYGAGSTTHPSSASWNLQSVKLARPAMLAIWTYLVISPEDRPMVWPTKDEFHATMDRLTVKLRTFGIQCPTYIAGQMIRVQESDAEGKITNAVSKFATNAQKRPNFVLVILPETQGTVLYNKVKQACDIQYGLLNSCVVDRKFARANDQYLANVCLKINLKLGGSNHILDPLNLGVIAEQKTMVVGIDVTHPSPGSTSTAPSVAAVVASIDSRMAQWPAELRIQTGGQEMVAALEDLLRGRLQHWRKKNNNALPQNIIIYRDGVSEGQYQLVLENELPAVRNACRSLYSATEIKAGRPRLSIIIVGKRHHTRFYASRVEDADRSGNPQNGTVVDCGITESQNWEFFLQAHAAIQGTARPAHYFVLLDEIFRGSTVRAPFASAADVLEDLTHNLCYLFGRATKAVSICPPAYYADLACERARCYLAHIFDPSISSVSDTISNTSGAAGIDDLGSVQIHDAVKDAMFYI